MGNSLNTCSIVNNWGDVESLANYIDPRYDNIEIILNKEEILTGVGLVRPIDGNLQGILIIIDLQDNLAIYHERFIVEHNYLETSFVKQLNEHILLEPFHMYKIRVFYEGSNTYTYKEHQEMIRYRKCDIEVRKTPDKYLEGNTKQTNMITSLQFERIWKSPCCYKA